MSMGPRTTQSAGDFSHHLSVPSVAGTTGWGAAVADILKGGDIILLTGPLGAGKTCFVQGLCGALKVAEEVVSPTFTLVNTYEGRLRVHHLDFYRVAEGDDLADIGVPDILDEVWDGRAVLLVEWPLPLMEELGPDQPRLEMMVETGPGPEDRTWHIRGVPHLTEHWQELLDRLEKDGSC
jgi:tRNA threonylcarbamoyladenosine biosynthesis protein TsaE|nr:tRNA (adenosine(37)-N6)-threonylcarbamoyltransferase complex ATPase subunit type 1 TsaE [Candidatus Krumholzibacteria bacterium]